MLKSLIKNSVIQYKGLENKLTRAGPACHSSNLNGYCHRWEALIVCWWSQLVSLERLPLFARRIEWKFVITVMKISISIFIKVHTATRWTIRHSLMLHWFADLMNVTEEVTIHTPNVSTLLSSADKLKGLVANFKAWLHRCIIHRCIIWGKGWAGGSQPPTSRTFAPLCLLTPSCITPPSG